MKEKAWVQVPPPPSSAKMWRPDEGQRVTVLRGTPIYYNYPGASALLGFGGKRRPHDKCAACTYKVTVRCVRVQAGEMISTGRSGYFKRKKDVCIWVCWTGARGTFMWADSRYLVPVPGDLESLAAVLSDWKKR